MTQLYFAYGSNMSTARMQERIPRAEPLGAARLEGHRLVCNKRGKDGTGKANLVASEGHVAWGVLFAGLAADDWNRLDRFEWGYERTVGRVSTHAAEPVEARLYLALAPETFEIPPFDWYRDHCLNGAREHALPAPVVRQIAGWAVEIDRR